jgi:hypothetical protein
MHYRADQRATFIVGAEGSVSENLSEPNVKRPWVDQPRLYIRGAKGLQVYDHHMGSNWLPFRRDRGQAGAYAYMLSSVLPTDDRIEGCYTLVSEINAAGRDDFLP